VRLPRLRSLRSRIFATIAVTVFASIVLMLGVGIVLVRDSSRSQALTQLARQAELLATREAGEPSSNSRFAALGTFLSTQDERVAILPLREAALLLPEAGGTALLEGEGARGTVDVRGELFLYAAQPAGSQAVVLLRAERLAAGDWKPFGLALLIAGIVGAVLAALGAVVLARTVARPIRLVAEASRDLAAGNHEEPLLERGAQEVVQLAASFNHMAAELDRAREAEQAFLLSVSHELKTPLAAIKGHAEALVDDVIPAEEAGEVIGREATRLERLVQDLLDLARLRARRFSARSGDIDLATVVGEIGRRYEEKARSLGIELSTAADGALPARGDHDRLLQVVSNLVENALRVTPAGGRVAVGVEGTALVIEDTGPGLDPEDLPQAFERFHLHGKYAENRAVGTGLGLAIARELTVAMGGAISVESEPGSGARFRVELLPAGRSAGAVLNAASAG
jgi:two-component system OmpR family sensor kinase